MNHLSVDCNCDGNPAEPEMNDVGILASYDPVALDQTCVDIVYNTDKSKSGALIERIESRNGIHTLEHAEKIGLGSREYNLINIDEIPPIESNVLMGDADNDGTLTAADATVVLQKVLNNSFVMPCEK